MISFLLTIPITIVLSLLLNKLFKILGLCRLSYKDKLIPYSGGTVIIMSIILMFLMLYITEKISFFKFSFFVMSLFCIYVIGFIDDILLENRMITSKNEKHFLFYRDFTGILKLIAVLSISCFMYYFANEEYWVLKAILTSLIINLFSSGNFKEDRIIKLYLLTWIILKFFYLRWTRELHTVSFIVIGSYFYFNIKGYSKLGDNGLSLIGFIVSMVLLEAFSTNIGIMILLTIILTFISLLLKKHLFFDLITKQLTRKAS